MKTTIFIICSFFLQIGLFSQSNLYHPFPEDEAIWNVNDNYLYNFNPVGCPCNLKTIETSYIQEGDTMINALMYNKIYSKAKVIESNFSNINQCGCETLIALSYFGAIRNDVSTKKVYFFEANNSLNSERILYDFDLNAGDTIPLETFGIEIIISSVDSVLLGSNYHKRFNFNLGNNFSDTSLIEGVGSLTGLIPNFTYFEEDHKLLCFQETSLVGGNSSFVPSGNASSCNVLGIIENDILAAQMQFKPNPATHEIYLNLSKPSKYKTIKIVDCLGAVVWESETLEKENHLDLSALNQGVYFLQLFENSKLIEHQKLILLD